MVFTFESLSGHRDNIRTQQEIRHSCFPQDSMQRVANQNLSFRFAKARIPPQAAFERARKLHYTLNTPASSLI